MNSAKLFSIVVFSAVLCFGAVVLYFLPFASFQGDLTRMALLPESLFGWTKNQPEIDSVWMRQASMKEADVLIVGDSFSDGRVWQSVLTKQGMKVRTESWYDIGNICEDFLPWLKAQGFKGKYLLIQSIERSFASRLNSSLACRHMQYHSNVLTDKPRPPPLVSFNVNRGDYSGKLSAGIKTWLRAQKYERMSQTPEFSSWNLPNNVKMARIPGGCELFSHTRCEDVLFLSYDNPEDFDQSILKGMETINGRLSGVKPIWAIVPDKTTTYLHPDKHFWNNAELRFRAPNLLRVMQHALWERTADLYPANNTHLSTTGYLLMGEAIFKSIQQTELQAQHR